VPSSFRVTSSTCALEDLCLLLHERLQLLAVLEVGDPFVEGQLGVEERHPGVGDLLLGGLLVDRGGGRLLGRGRAGVVASVIVVAPAPRGEQRHHHGGQDEPSTGAHDVPPAS
jgi:hypothetical protein